MSIDSPVRTDTLSTSDNLIPEEESLNYDYDLNHLYSSAARFECILATNDCIEGRDSSEDGANGFEDLVGKYLTPRENAISHQAVKLQQVAATGTNPSWSPTTTVQEPDSYEEEPDDSLDDHSDASSTDVSSGYDSAPVLNRKGTLATDAWVLEPEEVIRLLIDEFGALADDESPEKLLLETDGGLAVKDAFSILGVIHLTTHRLAFHASLIAANPENKAIKAGPVVIHRAGWRSRRRLWLELTPDMLVTYRSSSPADKIRPYRTILLSAVNSIEPADPKHPTYVRLIFKTQDKTRKNSGWAEFATIEAAIDWRKELNAAVFLYQHRRRDVLESDSDSGVRLSCPLGRIQSAEFVEPLLPGMARIIVMGDDGEHAIRLGTIYPVAQFLSLPQILADYKKRHVTLNEMPPVFLDCGPLSFATTDQSDFDMKDKAVRGALALNGDEEIWMTKASVYSRNFVNSVGLFVVSTNYIGFWCKYLTQMDLKYRLPGSKVRQAKPFATFTNCRFGLALEIEGHPDLKFLFRRAEKREEAISRISAVIKAASEPPTPSNGTNTPTTSVPPLSRSASIFSPLQRTLQAAIENGASMRMQEQLPRTINLPSEVLVKTAPKHFVALTIGSRGDVQPYIALGLGLMAEGHKYTIVTHDEYKPWIESFGIRHRQAGGDPVALMQLSVETKFFSPEFFKQSFTIFRPWLDQLLVDAWESCQGADVILESPSALCGVHIAEALNIPYFRCFTMPWTKTTDFPHAFLSPPVESASFNAASYVLFNNVMWLATSGQINGWRKNTLKLPSTNMDHLAQSEIPFVYNFSCAVVPKPLDWSDSIAISGYWFLDNPEGNNWTPPPGLMEWMAKARKDGKKIVYIGFGSITVPNPTRITARIVKAVLRADVRAIISKGWSARTSKDTDKEVEMPPECYQLDKVPHDWLFPQIDAAVHHGGAGTTGASLRAGLPTLIKPWFGDQFFWANRVQKLGAGLRIPSLHAHDLSEALIKATTSRIMKEKAAAVGEKIRAEDGVHTAIHSIYRYLDHASAYIEKIRSHGHQTVC